MLKQYVYRPEAAGLDKWPDGILRLAGCESVADPGDAHVIVYPGALHALMQDHDALEALPWFKRYEDRHVFFHCSDQAVLYHTTAMIIRCNTRTWYFDEDPQTISWPWPVDDFKECIPPPDGGFQFDLSFHGWNWSDVRKDAIASCLNHDSLRCDFALYMDFYGHLKDEVEQERRWLEHHLSLQRCRMALCPESIPGVFPYRFFEAMSAGRMPVLVGSDYVLPFGKYIPYTDFCVFIPRALATYTASEIAKQTASLSDVDFVNRGLLARFYWERYLQRDRWPELMVEAVRDRLCA